MARQRITAAQKLAAVAYFWANRDFRQSVLTAAKEQGITPRAINPDNLKLILDFFAAILPLIFQLFLARGAKK